MANFRVVCEEFKVFGRELVEQVEKLIHEGNVRRIIVRDERGNTYLEIPLAVATVGAIAAPVLAAVGALSALIANFKIVVERVEEEPPATEPPAAEPPAPEPEPVEP